MKVCSHLVRLDLVRPSFVLLILAASAGLYAQQTDLQAVPESEDPPSRVARVAVTEGAVSLEPAGVNQFAQAELNYPLTVGDRMYTDLNAFSSLEAGGTALRMGHGADLTVTSLTDLVAQFGLAQGSVHVDSHSLVASDGQQGLVEIDTPNGTVLVEREGNLRVDSYPKDDTTIVTVFSGLAEVTGPGLDQQLQPGMSLRLSGVDPTQVEGVQVPQQDALDSFDARQEQIFLSASDIRNDYVSDEMIGAADLDQYGDWSPDPDYGPVWYPSAVVAGWSPYTNGRWAWVAPWGWTWVEAEPWGFAPFHYGRWAVFHGRWGWVPGPPPRIWGGARPVRPIYSPALVAFVGGTGLSGGAGVTAWFPLGPREAYVPWYHASSAYVNRVNVTNLYSRDSTEVRNTYVNRTAIAYNINVTNVTYVNRTVATVAISQRDFAAGHSVARSEPVALDAGLRAQLDTAPIVPHPLVTPAPSMAAPQARAQAVPPNLARPVLSTRAGLMRTGSPGVSTIPAPITRAPGPLGHAAQPTQQPADRNSVNPSAGVPRPYTPAPAQQPTPAPVTRPQAPSGVTQVPSHAAVTPYPQPARPVQPVLGQTVNRMQPNQPQRVAPAPAAVQTVTLRAPEQQRPLVTRTLPQPAQPAFEEQRRAIETNDPGRPLGPQQVNNLRAGRPAGPPAQPEAAHPAPRAPASAERTPPPAPQPQKPK